MIKKRIHSMGKMMLAGILAAQIVISGYASPVMAADETEDVLQASEEETNTLLPESDDNENTDTQVISGEEADSDLPENGEDDAGEVPEGENDGQENIGADSTEEEGQTEGEDPDANDDANSDTGTDANADDDKTDTTTEKEEQGVEDKINDSDVSDTTKLPKKKPGAPTIKSSAKRCVGGSITITWNPVGRARGYRVYRLIGSKWVKVADLEGKTQVLYRKRVNTPGKISVYRVTAYNQKGESKPSNQISVTTTLRTPQITSLTSKKISWNSVSYAEYYNVYEWRSAEKGWKKIGSTTSTSFKLNSFNKKYYYTVRAVRGSIVSGCDTKFTAKYQVKYTKKYKSKQKILFEGDSVMALASSSNYFSWGDRSAAMLGMQYENRAVDGSSMVNSNTSKSVLYRSSKLGFKGYDIIVIAVGSNDYGHNKQLGTVNSTSTATFYGAYRKVLQMVKEQNPKARVILCTPVQRKIIYGHNYTQYGTDTKNAKGYTMKDLAKAIKVLAAEYNCEVFDAMRCGALTKTTVVTDTYDNAHPLANAQVRISEAFLKEMF